MSTLENVAYEQVRSWIMDRCGIAYPENKGELLRQRLTRVQFKYKIPDLKTLSQALLSGMDPDLEHDVMHAASTNHTYFYREQEVLDKFMEVVLPAVQHSSELRIWSAAASTGDEAYTIAMMLTHLKGLPWMSRVRILGTDLSGPSIDIAEAGVFPDRHVEYVPDIVRQAYLKKVSPEQFAVSEDIKRICTFRRMNLKTTPYPFQNRFQVVFCRNLLYYFDRADQIATLNAIYNVTEPGGWLLTSVTEAVRDLGTAWVPVTTGVYQKRS